ncbi:MAG: hypothetical protein ABIP03_08385 [Aquihabitans sp.]
MTDHKSPAEQAADYVIYAPLGFVLEARRLLPTLAERGRQQVTMAKMIGQFAVKQGQAEAGKRIVTAQGQAESILSELGLRPPGKPVPRAASTTPPSGGVAPAPAAPVPAPVQASKDADRLAIADYDSLAASQVIPRLAGLTPAELDSVRGYEASHRGRKTILGKVAQLQGE